MRPYYKLCILNYIKRNYLIQKPLFLFFGAKIINLVKVIIIDYAFY